MRLNPSVPGRDRVSNGEANVAGNARQRERAYSPSLSTPQSVRAESAFGCQLERQIRQMPRALPDQQRLHQRDILAQMPDRFFLRIHVRFTRSHE